MKMRQYSNGAAAGALLVAAGSLALPAAAADLTIVGFGGAFQDIQSRTLWQPAAEAMGITIREETYNSIAELRLQVSAGAVTWDIVTSGSGSAARVGAEGLLEPLDYSIIDVSNFGEGLVQEHCVGAYVFSTVQAWNTNTFGDDGPQSWADFWDPEGFPGTRSYRNSVAGALEPALMADGVPMEEVYEVLSSPGGIDRALDKIRELRPHIGVWWASGAQHAQLMVDGEVDMVTGWNGRFDVAADDGAAVAYTYNQGLLDFGCFAIPLGAPNRDLAMEFLAEISKPEYQAEMSKLITYGPTNLLAFELGLIDEEYARMLPSHPDNAAVQLPLDVQWYIEFEAEALAAYQDMLTE